MGCDIHLLVEKNVGDKWITVNTMKGHHTGIFEKIPFGTGHVLSQETGTMIASQHLLVSAEQGQSQGAYQKTFQIQEGI